MVALWFRYYEVLVWHVADCSAHGDLAIYTLRACWAGDEAVLVDYAVLLILTVSILIHRDLPDFSALLQQEGARVANVGQGNFPVMDQSHEQGAPILEVWAVALSQLKESLIKFVTHYSKYTRINNQQIEVYAIENLI